MPKKISSSTLTPLPRSDSAGKVEQVRQIVPDPKMVKPIFKDFCEETTAHAFMRIGDPDRRWWARILWFLVLLGFLAIFSWQCQLLVSKYMKYETIVNTGVSMENTLPFPTITLCNLNPYETSRLPTDSPMAKFIAMTKSAANASDMTQMQTMCQNSDIATQMFCGWMDVSGESANENATNIATAKQAAATSEHTTTTTSKKIEQSSKTSPSPITSPQNDPSIEATSPPIPSGESLLNASQLPPPPPAGGGPQAKGVPQDPPVSYPPLQAFRKKKRQAPGPQGPAGPAGQGGQQSGPSSLLPPQQQQPQPLQPSGGLPPPPPKPGQQPGPAPQRISFLRLENTAFKAIGVLSAMNKSLYENASQPVSDFIQDCQFNMASCSSDYPSFDHPWYGVCYKINPDRNMNFTTIRPGPLYGLALQLHVNQSQYLPSTFVIGVKIGINEPGEMAFPEVDGVFAPVGAATALGLSIIKSTKMGSPYGDCISDVTNLNGTDFYYYQGNYTIAGCRATCLQKRILDQCDCWAFSYSKPPADSPYADKPLCADIDDCACAAKVEMNADPDADCSCSQVCKEVDYKLTISHSLWPSAQLAQCPPDAPPDCSEHANDYALKNQLKLQIFYESMMVYTYSESPSYSELSLISDFGGQLGLWVGASFCTVFEILSLTITLFMACFGCTRHNVEKHPRRPQTSPSKHRNESEQANQARARSVSVAPPKYVVYPTVTDMYG